MDEQEQPIKSTTSTSVESTAEITNLIHRWPAELRTLGARKELLVTQRSKYIFAGRVADVLALIQVLAWDERAHRSDDGLKRELQGPPRSAKRWSEVAQEHPEFFRVRPGSEQNVSLIARQVTPEGDSGRPPLPSEYTSQLLRLAVELHDREVRRSQGWHIGLPILGVVIGGALTLLGVWLSS